ncbi:MAG: hypothetical protein WD098_04985 [Balneolales bacterium]
MVGRSEGKFGGWWVVMSEILGDRKKALGAERGALRLWEGRWS